MFLPFSTGTDNFFLRKKNMDLSSQPNQKKQGTPCKKKSKEFQKNKEKEDQGRDARKVLAGIPLDISNDWKLPHTLVRTRFLGL